MQMSFVSLAFRVKRPVRCGLTIRSTGPIAAGRHLGYKSLAQMPAHRNGPVSSNVSHHPIPLPSITEEFTGGSQIWLSKLSSASSAFGSQFVACASRSGAERQVSSIGRHAERGESRMLSNADPRRVVGRCNGRWQTARVVEEKQSSQPSQTEHSGQSPAPVGKTNTETKRKSPIVVVARFGN